MRARAHLYVSGHVQGVFFRESARRIAQALGLDGWVRNLPDGRVEAVFEGEQSAVERALAWCHHGPPDAHVAHVDTHWEPPAGEAGFSIHR